MSLQNKCLKPAISPSYQRSTMMARPPMTTQIQTTCPATALFTPVTSPAKTIQSINLINLAFSHQTYHLSSLRLRPHQTKPTTPIPHLPAHDHHSFCPLASNLLTTTLTACHPSLLLNTLPPSWATGHERVTHTHMCNLFCDANVVGLSSTGLPPIT